jgi:hypothetical protein
VCADDQYCNGEEICDGNGTCQPGTLVDCNDDIACTVDSCDEVNESCVNTPNDNNCSDDGLFCTGQEICDPVSGCVSTGNPCPAEELCDEERNQCARTPECTFDDECDDGMFCNGGEYCNADGMCQSETAPCSLGETCDESNDTCVAVEMDLDIVALRTTKWVRLKRVKDVKIKLIVENDGLGDTAMKRANVTGRQDGETVYSETIPVNDPVGRGRTTWTFPPYKPVNDGRILWTATIEDEDHDEDEKRATTVVLP